MMGRLATIPYLGIDRHHRLIDRPSCEWSNGSVRQPRQISTRVRGPTMNARLHVLRPALFSLALLGTMTGPWSAGAQSVTPEETVRSVRRMLERLPYYGVFDYIVFRVDRGTVYLAGYSFEGRLKADAEMATKRATGVFAVENGLTVAGAETRTSTRK